MKFYLAIETLQTLEEVRQWNCCLDEAYGTWSSDFMLLARKSYTVMAVNRKPREMKNIIRKGRDTACQSDRNRTILASDGQIAPILATMIFQTKPLPENSNDVTEVPLSPVLIPSDDLHTVLSDLNSTVCRSDQPLKRSLNVFNKIIGCFPRTPKNHGKTKAVPNPNFTIPIPGWLSLMKDVVTSSPTTESKFNGEPRTSLDVH